MAYSSHGSTGLIPRVFGAAFFNRRTYRDVRHDINATGQAILVILLSAVGVATTVGVEAIFERGLSIGILTAVAVTLISLIGWLFSSITVFLIGTKLFRAKATYGETLRTLGFSDSPGLLSIIGVLPFLGGIVRGVVGIWQILCGYVAIRETFDTSRVQAVITLVSGLVVYALIQLLLEGLLAQTGLVR